MNLGTYANIFLIVLKNTKKKSASDIKVDKKENSSRKKRKNSFFFCSSLQARWVFTMRVKMLYLIRTFKKFKRLDLDLYGQKRDY